MPMTYNSLIGDMGYSLSGGQKQRALLARDHAIADHPGNRELEPDLVVG